MYKDFLKPLSWLSNYFDFKHTSSSCSCSNTTRIFCSFAATCWDSVFLLSYRWNISETAETKHATGGCDSNYLTCFHHQNHSVCHTAATVHPRREERVQTLAIQIQRPFIEPLKNLNILKARSEQCASDLEKIWSELSSWIDLRVQSLDGKSFTRSTSTVSTMQLSVQQRCDAIWV